jgi:hypothetical protein
MFQTCYFEGQEEATNFLFGASHVQSCTAPFPMSIVYKHDVSCRHCGSSAHNNEQYERRHCNKTVSLLNYYITRMSLPEEVRRLPAVPRRGRGLATRRTIPTEAGNAGVHNAPRFL